MSLMRNRLRVFGLRESAINVGVSALEGAKEQLKKEISTMGINYPSGFCGDITRTGLIKYFPKFEIKSTMPNTLQQRRIFMNPFRNIIK